jgi:hypothetical protein
MKSNKLPLSRPSSATSSLNTPDPITSRRRPACVTWPSDTAALVQSRSGNPLDQRRGALAGHEGAQQHVAAAPSHEVRSDNFAFRVVVVSVALRPRL